ncbi:MAG: hypothetical protein MZW92_63680 [Comamonadaceae bacterium]|nr:hypothetical protein [Comamonadaceae bacterium]
MLERIGLGTDLHPAAALGAAPGGAPLDRAGRGGHRSPFDPGKPVCYALHVRQLSALLVLEEAAARLGLPRPLSPPGRAGQPGRNAAPSCHPDPQRPALAAAAESLRVLQAPGAHGGHLRAASRRRSCRSSR